MRASELMTGDRFTWERRNRSYPYKSPVSTVLADPRANRTSEITFPVVYDEPTAQSGDLYDVFYLDPDDEVDPVS